MSCCRSSLIAFFAAITLATPVQAGEVTGRTVTANGVGIPGIDIDVIEMFTGVAVTILDDDTDNDGSFDFDVPDGRYRIRFEADQGQPIVSREFVYWNLEERRTWTVTMELGIALLGRVVDDTGSPVAGVTIKTIRLEDDRSIHHPNDETGTDGRFAVIVPPNASYSIQFEPPPGSPWLALAKTQDLVDQAVDLDTITLARGTTVTGTVQHMGEGVNRADLDAFDETGAKILIGHDKTDSQGSFSLTLPPGTARLVASGRIGSGLAPAARLVTVGTEPLDAGVLSLPLGAARSGSVRDMRGDPVPRVAFALEAQSDEPVLLNQVRSNEEGDFYLEAAPGSYRLTGTAPSSFDLAETVTDGVVFPSVEDLNLVLLDAGTPIESLALVVRRSTAGYLELSWVVAEDAPWIGFRVFIEEHAVRRQVPESGWWSEGSAELIPVRMPGGERRLTARLRSSGTRIWLEAIDRTGRIERFGPAALKPAPPSRVSLTAHPTPWSPAGQVIAKLPEGHSRPQGPSDLSIFTPTGRLIAQVPAETGMIGASENSWIWPSASLPFNRLPRGVYWVSTIWGGSRLSGKVVTLQPSP